MPDQSGRTVALRRRDGFAIYLLAVVTALFMGLRFEVGGDWTTYLENYEYVHLLGLSQALATFDVGYSGLAFIATRLDTGIWLVNLSCAAIMTAGIVHFCMRQPNPALSFLVGVPYLVIVVGMGYTRQGVAIGLILAGLADADGRTTFKLVLWVLAAALFHRTALLMLPLVLAPIFRRNLLYAILGGLAFVVLATVLLGGRTDQLIAGYVDTDYESGGATIRVAMNFVPAIMALTLRRHLGFSTYQSDMWSVFALAALGTLVLVLMVSFTTAIDRMALFLIPLQIAILPRIPYALAKSRLTNAQWMVAVVGYSAMVQLVWLVFATHARLWVPYQMYGLNG